MMRAGRVILITSHWLARGALGLVGLVVFACGGGYLWLQSEPGRTWLAETVGAMASAPGAVVTLGKLGGSVPFAISVDRVTVADDQGVWATADRVGLSVDPAALLSKRLDITELTAARLLVARPPVATTPAAPLNLDLPVPPLPVPVTVRRVSVDTLRLEPPVTGGGEGATARLGGVVTLADGVMTATVTVMEAAGGFVAGLLALPERPPITVTVAISGQPRDWRARLDLTAVGRGQVGAELAVQRTEGGHGARLTADGDASRLVEPALAALIGASPSARLEATIDDAGKAAVRAGALEIAAGSATLAGDYDPAGGVDLRFRLEPRTGPALAALLPPDLGWNSAAVSGTISGVPASGLAVAVTADVTGLTGGPPKLARLAGPAVHLEGAGRVVPAAGTLSLDRLALITAAGRLSGTASARAGAGGGLEADFDLGVDNLKSGVPDIDRPLAKGARLAGAVAIAADGVIRADRLTLSSEPLSIAGHAVVTADRVDAGATLDAPRLAALTDSLGVKPAGGGHLTLTVGATGLPAAPRVTLDVKGKLGAHDIAGAGTAGLEGGMVTVSGFTLTSGANRVTATLKAPVTGDRADGTVTATVPNLAALADLIGGGFAGRIDADIALASSGREQRATVKGRAASVRAPGAAVANGVLDVSASAASLPELAAGRGAVRGRLEAGGVVSGTTSFSRITAAIEGDARRASFQARADGRVGQPLSLDLAGTAERAETSTRVTLTRLTGRAAGQPLSLERAAVATVTGDRVDLAGVHVGIGGARVDADAGLGPDGGRGRIALVRAPLSLVSLVNPGLALDGTLDAELTLAGSLAEPRADLTARVRGLNTAAARKAGVKGIDGDATGSWRQGRFSVNGGLTGARAGIDLKFRGAMPLVLRQRPLALDLSPNAPVEGGVTGALDLARLNDILSASGDRASGRADLAITVGGTLAAPQLGGRVTVANGRYENAASGAVFDHVTAQLSGSGGALVVEKMSASTSNGGTVSAEGRMTLAPPTAAGVAMKLTARNARVAQVDAATADVNADLTLNGTPAAMRLGGAVTVAHADLRVPDRMPPEVVDLKPEDAHAPGHPAVRPAKPAPPALPSGPAAMALDLSVKSSGGIFVRGHGLDAELGSDLTIHGTAAAPQVLGSLTMARGQLAVLGKSFDFSRGVIGFTGGGDMDPDLDLLAQAKTGTTTAQVQISGTAKKPKIELTSEPPLPQDEVMARVLFDKSVGSLSPLEAAQLADSAAELAGMGGSGGLSDRLRRTLGLSRLGLTGGSGGSGSALELGQTVSSGLYLGVQQGLSTESSRARLEYGLTDNLKIEGDVGATGAPGFGLKYEWEY